MSVIISVISENQVEAKAGRVKLKNNWYKLRNTHSWVKFILSMNRCIFNRGGIRESFAVVREGAAITEGESLNSNGNFSWKAKRIFLFGKGVVSEVDTDRAGIEKIAIAVKKMDFHKEWIYNRVGHQGGRIEMKSAWKRKEWFVRIYRICDRDFVALPNATRRGLKKKNRCNFDGVKILVWESRTASRHSE